MATTSSLTSPLQIKLCKKACKSCGLDVYQGPVLDVAKRSHLFWVGLSAVAFDEKDEKLPLSPLTPSGSLVQSIEAPFLSQFSFYKTNLVKCAPINGNKIRYPLAHEMDKCFPNFNWELKHLNPRTVFLLGKQVGDFISKKMGAPKVSLRDDFSYTTFENAGIKFIPIHHPSFILVYKRKHLQAYIDSLQSIIETTTTNTSKIIRCSEKSRYKI